MIPEPSENPDAHGIEAEVFELAPGISQKLREIEQISPEQVLRGALEIGLTSVVVVGRDRKGDLQIAGSHSVDQSLALLARGTQYLAESDLDIGFVETDEVG